MSIIKYYPNGEGTDPVYDIGTEGLEHAISKKDNPTLYFIANRVRKGMGSGLGKGNGVRS